MKIAIPVNDNKPGTSICQSFGRTPYFMIYDADLKTSVFLDNSAAASQGGAGIKAAQSIIDSGADVLLTPRCGENAAEVLQKAEIPIHRTINDDVQANVEAFLGDKLPLLTEIHPGMHQHGGR